MRTDGFNVELDVGAQDLVPSEDGRDDVAGVDLSHARSVHILEGRHTAEGVLEGGVGREVLVEGLLLLLGRALGKGVDDVLDLSSCKKRKKHMISLGSRGHRAAGVGAYLGAPW